MNFEISAEIFLRLGNVASVIPQRVLDEIDDATLETIKCVRLEYLNGHYYALASNKKIAAIFYLGKTEQPNGVAHITNDAKLLKQCEAEKAFGSTLFISVVPELQIASVKTTLGYNYPGNAGLFPPAAAPLNSWTTWVPKTQPAASKGAMSWMLDSIEALNKASPSGCVVFPEFIDAMHAVVLRDRDTPNWCGLFMANAYNDQTKKVHTLEPATLPEWWAK